MARRIVDTAVLWACYAVFQGAVSILKAARGGHGR
jgi:hypothetical protein